MNVGPVPRRPAADSPARLGQNAALPPLVDGDTSNTEPLGDLGQAHRLAVVHENDCTESLDRTLVCTDNPYMTPAWIQRLQCALCESFSFKIVEDGQVWMVECNHCGALAAAAEDQAGKKTHANGTWVKERVL